MAGNTSVVIACSGNGDECGIDASDTPDSARQITA
jgi:hypothetical protein